MVREHSDIVNVNDKRQAKVRFGWVKRLMQGQNRQPPLSPAQPQRYVASSTGGSSINAQRTNTRYATSHSQKQGKQDNEQNDNRSMDTEESDNISTIPIKSLVSLQSTHTPSIISNGARDTSSINASTTNTSFAPSTQHNMPTTQAQAQTQSQVQGHGQAPPQTPGDTNQNTLRARDGDETITENTRTINFASPQNIASTTSVRSAGSGGSGTPAAVFGNNGLLPPPQDRDSESIVTLASSSRRTRRKSIDTNCSTAGIPPASISERLAANPATTASSVYAGSTRTTYTGYTSPDSLEHENGNDESDGNECVSASDR